MTAPSSDESKTFADRFKDLLDKLFRRRRLSSPRPAAAQAPRQVQPQYKVTNAQGQSIGQTDSLSEAQVQWLRQTQQEGHIIDTKTGEDVTPEPDDDGRYVVLDKDSKQLASFRDRNAALHYWRNATKESGSIIDTKTGEDITVELKGGFLTDQQLQDAVSHMYAQGIPEETMLSIDPQLVERMMRDINRLKVPVFDVTNIVGSNSQAPKKTVSIKRRKMTIEKVREIVTVDGSSQPKSLGRKSVPYPTELAEQKRIRDVKDITRVRPRHLAIPRSLLGQRLANRELPMLDFQEEVQGTPVVKKRRIWQEVERPKVEEWTEEVEVTDEARAQLLEFVVDISGSMEGPRINLAMALASLLVSKHLDDDSRYFYRQFASAIGGLRSAQTPSEKRQLLHFFISQTRDDLGHGTNIQGAIQQAAEDVHAKATSGDRPEVLLITDGESPITAQEVYDAIGEDVTLHAVVVSEFSGNKALRQHATTYYRLRYSGTRVEGSDKDFPGDLDMSY